MSSEVMCAFCGDAVTKTKRDPCAFVVITRWRAPKRKQKEQQFWAHAACILSRMHPEAADVAKLLKK